MKAHSCGRLAEQVIEAPAGLMDANESAQEAGLRELYEETGLRADVKSTSPAVVLDPGMSDTNTVYIVAEVDAHESMNCVAHNDDG